jgi:hypothetical protein
MTGAMQNIERTSREIALETAEPIAQQPCLHLSSRHLFCHEMA